MTRFCTTARHGMANRRPRPKQPAEAVGNDVQRCDAAGCSNGLEPTRSGRVRLLTRLSAVVPSSKPRSAGVPLDGRGRRRPQSGIVGFGFWKDFTKVSLGDQDEAAGRLDLAEPLSPRAQRRAIHVKNANGFVTPVDERRSSLPCCDWQKCHGRHLQNHNRRYVDIWYTLPYY